MFAAGLALWLLIGIAAALTMRVVYKAAETATPVTFAFGIFGAFIGGMLGMSPYIHHNPVPLRFGGILGALLGAVFFTFLYHYTARKAI